MSSSRPSPTTLAAALALAAALGVAAWVLLDSTPDPATASEEPASVEPQAQGPQAASYQEEESEPEGPTGEGEGAGTAASTAAGEGGERRLKVTPPPPVGKVDDIKAEIERLERERLERERLEKERREQQLAEQAEFWKGKLGLNQGQADELRDLLLARDAQSQELRDEYQNAATRDAQAWDKGWADIRSSFQSGLERVLTAEQIEAYYAHGDGNAEASNNGTTSAAGNG